MMTDLYILRREANRALRARTDDRLRDALEDERGASLCMILDSLAFDAQEMGETRLERRLVRAFNEITGRDENGEIK
jgi:hypothetical protein